MIATRWEWRIMTWWPSEERNGNNSWDAPDGKKRIVTIKNNYEDGMKLEPWISGRTGKDLRGTLLRSSNVENDDENHHELLRYSGRMKNKKVQPTRKKILKPILENIWLMRFILTPNFEMNLGIAPGKLGESGKILGKDLWFRSHSKGKHRWTIDWKGGLHRLN